MSLVAFLAFLQGCSWVEVFVIYNKSDKAIYVTYELKDDPKKLALFYDSPSIYKLNTHDNIDWTMGKYLIEDEDSEFNKVRMAIPPHSAMVFGGLHNDKYKSYDQTFINGRTFNLSNLQILFKDKSMEVIPSTFDKYFKKRRGQIHFIVN